MTQNVMDRATTEAGRKVKQQMVATEVVRRWSPPRTYDEPEVRGTERAESKNNNQGFDLSN